MMRQFCGEEVSGRMKIGYLHFVLPLLSCPLLWTTVENVQRIIPPDFDQSMDLYTCGLGLTKKYKLLKPKKFRTKAYKRKKAMQGAQGIYDFAKMLYNANKRYFYTPNSTSYIPKVIHQIWIGPKEFPEGYNQLKEMVKKLHPGWQHKLWTDADVERFKMVNKEYYDRCVSYREKADIFRYEILYRYGGVYLDIDIEPLKSLEHLHHCFKFYTAMCPLDASSMISNAIIGSIARHPILKKCMDNIRKDAHSKMLIVRAGPHHYSKCFYKAARGAHNRVIVLPKTFFFPLAKYDPFESLMNNIRPETFAIHYWDKSHVGMRLRCDGSYSAEQAIMSST